MSKFSNECFRKQLIPIVSSDRSVVGFENIINKIMNAIDKSAPLIKKTILGNEAPFTNKKLRKSIMNRTRLRNRFRKHKTERNKETYRRQRNICLSINRKSKRAFWSKLDPKDVSDNRNFWKTVNPSLSSRHKRSDKISLLENDNLIQEDSDICEVFIEHFSTVVAKLNLSPPPCGSEFEDSEDLVINCINKFRNHCSVKAINSNFKFSERFAFRKARIEEIRKFIMKLDPKKSTHITDLPVFIVTENVDIFF